MVQKKKENGVLIFLAIVLSYFTYLVVMDGLSGDMYDYHGHTYVYLPIFTRGDWLEGWKTVPYMIWHLGVLFMNEILHIPVEMSAVFMSSILTLFSYFLFYWIIKKYTVHIGCEEINTKAAFLAFAMCVVQSLDCRWFDIGSGFLGTFSINPTHSATQMAARPFSLLCICLAYDIWQKQKNEEYVGIFFRVEKGLKKYYFLLAAFLFLSTCAKPTFAEMFIPALGIVMLIDWIIFIRRKDGSAKPFFKHCLWTLLCAVPSLIHILVQALAYTIFGGSFASDSSFMFTKPFEVWSFFSENVALSVVFGMAFPLALVLINLSFFLKDDLGRMGLVSYLVGFAEASILGESGARFAHGNFFWPMMSGMLVMWTVSLLRLLKLEREQTDKKVKYVLINVVWFIFWLHTFYGLMAIINI